MRSRLVMQTRKSSIGHRDVAGQTMLATMEPEDRPDWTVLVSGQFIGMPLLEKTVLPTTEH